jgi:hypothetical protein
MFLQNICTTKMLYGATTQKTTIYIHNAVKTLNPTLAWYEFTC